MRARLGLHRKTDDDRSLVDALPEEDDLAAPPGEEPLGYKTFCGT